MDVTEFVSEALRQILEGVRKAQSQDHGENINAKVGEIALGGNVINAGAFGMVTRVDFDIAVSAESTAKAGANLKVAGIGFEGGGDTKHGAASRISFSVPVRLPDGDTKRSEKVAADESAAMDRAVDEARRFSRQERF